MSDGFIYFMIGLPMLLSMTTAIYYLIEGE